MEPWKIAVIAALGVGIVGFGMISNRPPQPVDAENPSGVQPTPGPPQPLNKFVGGTVPTWPSMTQWANTSAPTDLSSLKGKPVFLEVFRIECSHCQEAAPLVARMHARYAPRGVAFVGIQSPGDTKDPANPENDWATVQKWLKTEGYTWPVGFDAKSAWFQGKMGNRVTYPSMFLLDKNGKVIFVQSGHDQQKALQLAVELERLAPGKGDVNAQATDLSSFLLASPGETNDPAMQKSLATEIAARLKSQNKTPQKLIAARAGA